MAENKDILNRIDVENIIYVLKNNSEFLDEKL